MSDDALIQGTDEWKAARCGSLGASRIADATAQTKSGWGASRANLMAELLVERLTGNPTDGFVNDAMRWGTEQEPHARNAYEFRTDNEVVQVGLIRHPTIRGTHASPDGLIGDSGMLEIKCPSSATHLDTLLNESIPEKYIKQMQWQMCCAGRKWCDFVSFDPRMPEEMRLFVRRIERDEDMVKTLTAAVWSFIVELDEKVDRLTRKYGARAAA